MFIDTHSHLFFPEFKDDYNEVIQRTVDQGITTLFTVGVDIKTSQIALDLESDKVRYYSTIGIHPHNAHEYQNEEKLIQDVEELEKIYLQNPQKVIGVGECGLDYMFQGNPDFIPTGLTSDELKSLQKKLFQAHINLAKKLDLPLIIHCRDDRSKDPNNIDSWMDVLEMAGSYKGILHCYSGKEKVTKQALKTDYLFSFAGNMTYPKNDYLREAVKIVPPEKICLETDCPFLPPQSIRGQRNEPSSVIEIAQYIADIKGLPLDEVAQQTTQNIKQLFNLIS